jgi:hypothetical protein
LDLPAQDHEEAFSRLALHETMDVNNPRSFQLTDVRRSSQIFLAVSHLCRHGISLDTPAPMLENGWPVG